MKKMQSYSNSSYKVEPTKEYSYELSASNCEESVSYEEEQDSGLENEENPEEQKPKENKSKIETEVDDIDRLNTNFNLLFKDFRETVLENMKTTKANIQSKYFADLSKQEKKFQTETTKLQQIVEQNKELIFQLKNKDNYNNFVITGLTKFVKTRQIRHRLLFINKTSLKSIFKEWHKIVTDKKRINYEMKKAEKYHNKKILRKVMSEWLHVYRREHDNEISEFWRSKVEESATEIIRRYESKLQLYQIEIDKLRNKIDENENERVLMLEDMKRVFLKGVSTMNLEALKYFNDK